MNLKLYTNLDQPSHKKINTIKHSKLAGCFLKHADLCTLLKMASKLMPIFIKIKVFLVCHFLKIKSHISKDEEKNFICSKFQALIQTLSHSRKTEYACDTCGSQFTSRIMRTEPIHKHLTSGARECFQTSHIRP